LDSISDVERQLIVWLHEHKRRPKDLPGAATEAEVLEAKVAKTFNKLRSKAKGDRIWKAITHELDEV
jgi:hypothetical protein